MDNRMKQILQRAAEDVEHPENAKAAEVFNAACTSLPAGFPVVNEQYGIQSLSQNNLLHARPDAVSVEAWL